MVREKGSLACADLLLQYVIVSVCYKYLMICTRYQVHLYWYKFVNAVCASAVSIKGELAVQVSPL